VLVQGRKQKLNEQTSEFMLDKIGDSADKFDYADSYSVNQGDLIETDEDDFY
jgi:hypothetical protein